MTLHLPEQMRIHRADPRLVGPPAQIQRYLAEVIASRTRHARHIDHPAAADLPELIQIELRQQILQGPRIKASLSAVTTCTLLPTAWNNATSATGIMCAILPSAGRTMVSRSVRVAAGHVQATPSLARRRQARASLGHARESI